MALITLLTDFGDKDYYVGLFKGDLSVACPSVKIVDISHPIQLQQLFSQKMYIHTFQKAPFISFVCLNKDLESKNY